MNGLPSIDVVYTWVDESDPEWQSLYQESVRGRQQVVGEHHSASDAARFVSRGELYYSIRSVRRHAPWVRNIYVVSNCAPPSWFGLFSNLLYVHHEDLFPGGRGLPTFNSHAIETVLHRIEGLSERFIYFNDDVFLCRDVEPEDFFCSEGGAFFFPSPHDIPYGRDSSSLRPVDQGAINSAALLFGSFKRRPEKKLHHTAHPLIKSILREIEYHYAEPVESTRGHAFRHPEDVAMATTLHAYYAYYTGRGMPKGIATRYIDIGDPRFVCLVHPWSPLMRGKYVTLCLNEVTDIRHLKGLRDRIVARVLCRLFDREQG
ncbi:stealth conserved region 3 domain-containing protein [Thioalkalivibrio sp. AKL7]|uniref:stealth conserved region 3 domain-containing protein n=1 Tax=Thioalkalivibrio sp. AKL7 TaxID=1158155 RepID=UPI0018CA8273